MTTTTATTAPVTPSPKTLKVLTQEIVDRQARESLHLKERYGLAEYRREVGFELRQTLGEDFAVCWEPNRHGWQCFDKKSDEMDDNRCFFVKLP